MRQIVTITSFLISTSVFSQIEAVILNSESGEPIPFVNIWVENENTGTTSNEQGKFILNTMDYSKTIVFSAIGFATKEVQSDSILNIIELTPQSLKLPEVTIKAENNTENQTIGSFKRLKIHNYFSCGTTPWIVARLFNYKPEYANTPYLNKIRLLTKSYLADSKFNIRLFSLDKNGEPGTCIYDKNIIGIAKKGKRITEIDLSSLNVIFPEKGIFIAFEWLIIDSNKYEQTTSFDGDKKKHNVTSFAPKVGTTLSNSNEYSFIYTKGNWARVWDISASIKSDAPNYLLLAAELELSD